MIIIYQIYILIYRLKYWLKKKILWKIFLSNQQKEIILLENILNLVNQKNINLKKFISLSESQIPEQFLDKCFLSFIFFRKRRIKKKIPHIHIKNNKEFEKIYFYYKLFILIGWLSESYKIREYLINFKIKENPNVIENMNKKKVFLFSKYLKKKVNFRNYYDDVSGIISNKKIAIVGPASNKATNGKEIDDFDIVIRINQLSRENLGTRKGYKTDIIFLNGVKSDQAILQNNLKFIKNVKIVFVKNNSYMNIFKDLGFKNVKLSPNVDSYFALGIANMLPFILFEILKYNPKKIKIFDNDLMLNPKRVKNYQKYSNYRPKDFLRMLTHHDAVSQLNFVKYLFKNSKIIRGDKNFNSAIKLDEKDYLRKLETNYKLDKI